MSEEQYAGDLATTIGLTLVGATAAKAVVQGIKASTVLSKISGALGDLADATKVAQYVNRLNGIEPSIPASWSAPCSGPRSRARPRDGPRSSGSGFSRS